MNRRLYSFGPFQLNTSEQLLLRDGQALPLKPKVFEVLAVLVQNSGRVVSKDALMKQVWSDSFVEEGNLAVCVFEIRKALGGSENGHRYIETVPRRGYRFVKCVIDEAPSTSSQQSFDIHLPPMSVIGDPGLGESSDKPTIAVLPFKSIGANANRFLGLGLAEALITKLSGLSQVTVRPVSSIRKYDKAPDRAAIGNELNVQWVLEGSIQKSGKRIRVTVKLVNVGEGVLQWAEKFDVEFTSVFAVEDSISEQIASELELKLSANDKRLLARRPTKSLEAYEAYLKSQYFYDKRTNEGANKAIQYLEQAIKDDPGFAAAYVGLADCYDWLRIANVLSPAEANLKSESVLLRAMELDSGLAVAHTALGMLRTRQWNWSAADREFKRAIELNPKDSRAYSSYAIYLAQMGQFNDALAAIKSSVKLNPLSLRINSIVASILYLSREYDKAIEQNYRTLEFADFPLAHVCLGLAYEAQGKYKEALTAFRHARRGFREAGPELAACFARIDALAGRRDKALKAIEELVQPKKHCLRSNFIALIYTALGNSDEAFHWLEKAYVEHDDDLGLLKVDHRWDALRGDPRFMSLLERVGLAD